MAGLEHGPLPLYEGWGCGWKTIGIKLEGWNSVKGFCGSCVFWWPVFCLTSVYWYTVYHPGKVRSFCREGCGGMFFFSVYLGELLWDEGPIKNGNHATVNPPRNTLPWPTFHGDNSRNIIYSNVPCLDNHDDHVIVPWKVELPGSLWPFWG